MANHFRCEVLNGWQSLATSHWSPELSAGISRYSCWYTISVSVARWSISYNPSANARSWKWIVCFLLLNWTYDDAKPQKYTHLKLKINTSQGHLADGAWHTSVINYWFDSASENHFRIQVTELLCNDAYLTKVINNKTLWFTRMEVLDLIHHQCFFTANSVGR